MNMSGFLCLAIGKSTVPLRMGKAFVVTLAPWSQSNWVGTHSYSHGGLWAPACGRRPFRSTKSLMSAELEKSEDAAIPESVIVAFLPIANQG